jgi:hypothetical protein
MEEKDLTAISDVYRLAIANYYKIKPTKTEHTGRFWAYFPRKTIETILADYDAGTMTVVARDFVASIQRTKDTIFEAERARTKSGGQNATTYR